MSKVAAFCALRILMGFSGLLWKCRFIAYATVDANPPCQAYPKPEAEDEV